MIQHPLVRVLNRENLFVADLPLEEARAYARNQLVDLVLVDREGRPPVCKLCHAHEYVRELQKKKVTKVPYSTIAFDPGQRERYIALSVEEAQNDMCRKIQNARRLLRLGYCTTFLLRRSPSVSSLRVGTTIQHIVAAVKDVGTPITPYTRTSQFDQQLLISLQVYPVASKETAVVASCQLPSLAIDDAPSNEHISLRRN